MRISIFKELLKDDYPVANETVLENISDTLLSLSKEAVQLAVQLKENSNKIEHLIAYVTKPSHPDNSCRKVTSKQVLAARSKLIKKSDDSEKHCTILPSTYWAFE